MQQGRKYRIKQTLAREINTAIDDLVNKKKPKVLITEKLSSDFGFNKGKIKSQAFLLGEGRHAR